MISEAKLKRREDVLQRESDGEAVLLDAEKGTYYSLNKTGAAIWDLLENETTMTCIHDALEVRYNVPAGRLMQDLKVIIADMQDNGLLQDSTATAE